MPSRIKLTDYVVNFLAELGIRHVFGVTGGAVVHLFDSAFRHSALHPVFTHHEQAAAFAAQAYARTRNDLGVAFVTTGPGGTNAITGLAAAWLDSIPCMFISGQTRLAHTTRGKPIRQLGPQQLDIIELVKPITKYAVLVDDPKAIKYHLQKAIYLARSGRPGPVWLDLPLDLQWASIDPETLQSFDPREFNECWEMPHAASTQVKQCIEWIANSKRPLILAGYGIRLANAENEFVALVERLRIPYVSSWNASDLTPTHHPLYVGRPGMAGQRGANLAVQNCDLLLCIGSHLSIPLTGTIFQAFAREAKIIMVDVDSNELKKGTVRVDLPIHLEVKTFLSKILPHLEPLDGKDINPWQERCAHYKCMYNSIPSQWLSRKNFVDPYVFIDTLSNELDNPDVIVVDGGGTITQIAFQAFRVKQGQRLMIDAGLCAMGSGLPSSIGAYFGSGGKRTVCLCGDGSMQFNIHELQTILHHCLPIKIFVINNGGYLSIRHTQNGFLKGNYVGSDKNGGMSLPDLVKVATAYGIPADRAHSHKELKDKIRRTLGAPGPALCEIMIPRDQQVVPRQGFYEKADGTFATRPLEDMYPFLERGEFLKNMIVKPLPESK